MPTVLPAPAPFFTTPPAYSLTIRNSTAAYDNLTATPDHFNAAIRAAQKHGTEIEALPGGTVTMTNDFGGATGTTVVVFTPLPGTEPGRITPEQAADLAVFTAPAGEERPGTVEADDAGTLRISAGSAHLAAATAQQLIELGWLHTLGRIGDRVTLSRSGRCALLHHRLTEDGTADRAEYDAQMRAALLA